MSPKTNLEKGVGSLCDIRTAPIAVLLMIALLSASVLVAVSQTEDSDASDVQPMVVDGVAYAACGNDVVEAIAYVGLNRDVDLVIPETVMMYDASADLREYTVVSISDSAFNGCVNLASVTIPDTVTSIGDRAFRNCILLKEVSFGSGVTSIGALAFNNCANLTSVTFPEALTSIGAAAFQDCPSISSVTLGGAETIGDYAFVGCFALRTVYNACGADPSQNCWPSADIQFVCPVDTPPVGA